jgi:phosphopentomutase
MSGRRAFVVVLDACGVGALPDAGEYGDAGTDTLGHLAEAAGGLRLPWLGRLGLGCVEPLEGVAPVDEPVLHGRLHALGPGKDSTAGHWELMGVVPPWMPTFPDGFPAPVIETIRSISGREVICNRASNGIEAIEHFGAEHVESGSLIVYTSQDSVLQVAAHVDVVPAEELYTVCAELRGRLGPEFAVGRVIARPFTGAGPRFRRTDGRRDFSLGPPSRSYLEDCQAAGVAVHAVGKVGQLFAGKGIDEQHPGATNRAALAVTTRLMTTLEEPAFVFTNLVETDQVYGHRHDVAGFHRALQEIDLHVARWLELLGPEDLLVLTADHGCDPTSPRTDHTREHVPLLARFAGHGGRRHDGPLSDVGASVLDWTSASAHQGAAGMPGESFVHA